MTENPEQPPGRRLPLRRVVVLATVLLLGLAAGGAAVHPVTRAGLETLPLSLEELPATLDEVRDAALQELREWVDRAEPGDGGVLSAAPGAEHPPVLLVPGWSDRAAELEEFRLRLVRAGWDSSRVLSLEFHDPVGSNLSHAEEVAAAVDRLRRESGAPEVDIVAFSMGGLAVRHYLLFENGEASTRRVAFLATPHRGTAVAVFGWGDGAREMIPGSPFLERLNGEHTLAGGVEMAAFRTPVDTRVVPHTSAVLPGAANVEICCPGHSEMLRDHGTFLRVADFLLRAPAPDGESRSDPPGGASPGTPPGEAEGQQAQGLDPIPDPR